MKYSLLAIVFALISFKTFAAESPKIFDGATPEPIGHLKDSVSQLRIRFPGTMVKREALQVTCTPEASGFSGWADNNTLWTYDFKAKKEWESPRLAGGTKCRVSQKDDLQSEDGQIWKAGTIQYDVIVDGPNVLDIVPAYGFKGALRDLDPVVMIVFDGDVNRESFFRDGNASLSYVSPHAPGEKITLTPVPTAQEKELFKYFKRNQWLEQEFESQSWILATTKRRLIPGAKIVLEVQKQRSAHNVDVQSTRLFSHNLEVRSQFEAKVACVHPSEEVNTCMPNTPITVEFNGRIKWVDVKNSYIEYVPFQSTDGKTVRAYPTPPETDEVGLFQTFLWKLQDLVPALAQYRDTLVESITFNVRIEPQTQAKIVLPDRLVDIEGRPLSNPLSEFYLRLAPMSEALKLPQRLAIFERRMPQVYLPVGAVDLNQKLMIRKTGPDADHWTALRDPLSIINLIRAYESRGDYRDTIEYKSPLEQLGIQSSRSEIRLQGHTNRNVLLRFPFVRETTQTPASGLYAFEINSPTLDALRSDPKLNQYYNPRYVLAQVTDLSVHLRRGRTRTLAWVTRMSDGKPVGGIDIEVFNCLGQSVIRKTTDRSGLAAFDNPKSEELDCQRPEHTYSSYFNPSDFYVIARNGGDFTFTHTSWNAPNGYAFSAPGIDYFYSDVEDGRPHFHGIVGVNLVKPGQRVPIELIAKLPVAKGFVELNPENLPQTARIVYSDDSHIFYEFPLTWRQGRAVLEWQVPTDSAVKLGRYSIELRGPRDQVEYINSSDIEVAEFKIPLMSGLISFPQTEWVRPTSLPVSSVIRYANGIGAKNLPVELSYYFEPTITQSKKLPEFIFGTGPIALTPENGQEPMKDLPDSTRPARLEGLSTGPDGNLRRDLALEKMASGKTIAEALKTLERPQTLVVRVRYQDQMGEYQTLSQAKSLYNASTYVGTHLVSGTRDKARLQAAVMKVSGEILTSAEDLALKVVRIESQVIGEEIFGGLIKNTYERSLKEVPWAASCRPNGKPDAALVSCEVGALAAGTYAFQATSKSAQQSAHMIFKVDREGRVYGAGEYFYFGDQEENKQLPLALNKPSYRDGEKAVVSFPAPFKTCNALVTLERAEVISSFVDRKACEKGYVEIPVDATLAPNAFVSVYALTGRADGSSRTEAGDVDLGRPTYRLGFALMKVDWNKFRALVEVKTDKPKYEPGETVKVDVSVQAEDGRLGQTTATLVAIEEKILELKKNDTYKILDALMMLRGHSVESVTPLERVETVTAGQADREMAKMGRKGGDEGGDGGADAEFKRRLFDALVSFQPDVPVVNGQAQFKFQANDSLAKFKIFAIVADSGQKFGSGEASYLSEKATQSFSNIPPVARTGDQFPIRVTVQNNSGASATYKTLVEAVIRGRDNRELARKSFEVETTLASADSKAVEVGRMLIPEEATSVRYVVRILNAQGQVVDAMEPAAQIIQPAVPLAIHDSYLLSVDTGSLSRTLAKEPEALPGQGELRVSLSKSLVTGALTQIVNRLQQDTFADFFIETKIFKALLTKDLDQGKNLRQVLESLLGSIDSEGFIKYYPQASRGDVWLTASILNALQSEPDSWKLAPPALVERLKGAVSLVLTRSIDPKYIGEAPMNWLSAQSVMGRAAYAFEDASLREAARSTAQLLDEQLQQNPKAYGMEMTQWSNRDLVDYWLLNVFARPEKADSLDAHSLLRSASRLNYSGNSAALTGHPEFIFCYSDETLETAKLLLGQSRLAKDKNLARALSVGLVNASAKAWYVGATMMNVAIGLKQFARAFEATPVRGNALIEIPEQSARQAVDWEKSVTADLKTLWTAPRATLKVTQTGPGQPWLGVQALSAVPRKTPLAQGLMVDKTIRNITRDSGFKAGDILEVTLKVNASNTLRHVGLNDPIPAGSNILSEAYGSFSSGEKSYLGYKIYFDYLPIGETVVRYQYQLNNPGTFQLPPTRIEGLFMPSIFGETPNPRLKVE